MPMRRTRGRKSPPAGEAAAAGGADDVKVVVTGASEQSFPRISVQFEVKRPDGSFLLDARARRLSRDRGGAAPSTSSTFARR